MYTINFVYDNKENLKNFIKKNGFETKKNILIQVFSGIVNEENIEKLIKEIKTLLPRAKILGTTTDGEILDCRVLNGEMVLSFSIFEKTAIRTALFEKKELSSTDLGVKINNKINQDTKAVIIFADGLTNNGEHLIKAVTKDVKIAGGFAGDNYNLKKTVVFTEEGTANLGCAAAFLDGEELTVNNDYNLNWEGIGKTMTVTKAENEIVYEINNIPVKQIYKKYFGSLIDNYLLEIGLEFPLITCRNGRKIARAVIGEGDDYLVYAGNIYEGETVQFGYASINDILNQDVYMFKKLSDKPVESLFIYECMARRRFFSNRIEYEYLPISDVNVSGFFTYGEFYGNGDKCFFNQSITYLALSENKNTRIKIKEAKIHNKDDFLVCQALTNLIKSTTKDLFETSQKLELLAHTDTLTDILNRKGCMKQIEEINTFYTLLLIDIDHFKEINDKFGHDVGDFVLKEFSEVIKSHIRKKDIFCRFGGEEFLLILPETSFDDGVKIAKKLRRLIENTLFDGFKITISIGVSEHKAEFKETFKKADENLYKAKKSGRNKVGY